MKSTATEDICAIVLNQLVETVVRKTARKERRCERVKHTCEGCSQLAVDYYGYGGHPSQIRHMGLGGCLSNEYLQADSDVSSDYDTDSDSIENQSLTKRCKIAKTEE